MKQITTSARVQVTLEIPCDSRWGEECKLDQVYKQAGDEIRGKLANWKSTGGAPVITQIIGEPVIVAITSERRP